MTGRPDGCISKCGPSKTAEEARSFLKNLIEKAPFVISRILTDKGKEFTDRFCSTGEREPTGKHLFDQECAEHGIEHRLIKPRNPQSNGMVEHFNGRIEEVVQQIRFESASQLEEALIMYLHIYNLGGAPLWCCRIWNPIAIR